MVERNRSTRQTRGNSPEAPLGESGQTAPRGGAPTQGQSTRNEFLKPEHLPGDYGIEFDLTIASPIRLYTGGEFGPQIIIGVTLHEKVYDWSLKIGGQQFVRLEKKFGKDLIGWPHRVVAVRVAVYNDKDYIEVVE